MVTIRVGLIQVGTKKLDLEYNFAQSCKLIRAAARKGAQILVTPESMLDGFAIREKEFQTNPQKYCLTIDDDHIQQYCSLAAELHCNLMLGLSLREVDERIVIYRNAVLFINNRGELQGKYIKIHTEYNDTEFRFYKHGEEYPIFNCPIGEDIVPIGVMICYDGFLPEVARILRVKGAHIIFNPAASTKFLTGWATRLAKVRAFENRCFVIGINHAYPRFCGYSFVVNPLGRVIKRLMPWPSACVVNLNLDLIEKGQKGLMTRRPSTYQELLQQLQL